MWEKSEKREFKVGDKIVKKNWYCTTTLKVTRVTKTQAVCEVKRADGTGYVDKYRKEYYVYFDKEGKVSHYSLTEIPRIEYNTNEYSVITE